MNSNVILSLFRLEFLRLRYIIAFLLLLPIIILSIAYLPTSILYLTGIVYYRSTLAVIYPLIPFIAALLLGSGMISEDAENNTLLNLLALPVKRSRLWAVRHLFRGVLLCLVLLLWYIFNTVSVHWILNRYLKSSLKSDKIILFLLVAGLIYVLSSVFSIMMENNFSSILSGFSGGLVTIFIIRKSPLAYPHYEWLLLFSIVYFLIVSLDLFTCGHPIGFRSLYKRFALWVIIYLSILFIPCIF